MAKAVKKKAAKKRADKYEERLTINGTFEDVIALSVTSQMVNKKTELKKK